MAKVQLIRPYVLDVNGHPSRLSEKVYRLDQFYCFAYCFTPATCDQNHQGHVSIYGVRDSGHDEDRQVLLFRENGVDSEEGAYLLMKTMLTDLGFEIIIEA